MKLSYLKLCGFRGYREMVEVDFSAGFNVIDGRNGVGKSTLCDAIEFVLTGAISKYREAKADQESVSDYIWWRGEVPAEQRFVELGLRDEVDRSYRVRRAFGQDQADGLSEVEGRLVDLETAPGEPLRQLCESLLIRDEFIASLSLDLTESKRFQFLREALGSIEAEGDIQVAKSVHQHSKKRHDDAREAVDLARARLAAAVRRLDDARGTVADDASISAAATALESLLHIGAPPEELAARCRPAIAELQQRIENLEHLRALQRAMNEKRQRLDEIENEIGNLGERKNAQESALRELQEKLPTTAESSSMNSVQETVVLLSEIAELGEQLGLVDSLCPLCGDEHSDKSFAEGVSRTVEKARKLDAQFAEFARSRQRIERDISVAREALGSTSSALSALDKDAEQIRSQVKECEDLAEATGVSVKSSDSDLESVIQSERRRVVQVQGHLAVIETLSLHSVIGSASAERANAQTEIQEAERRLADARVVEARAKSLFDAARRASAETVDRRLEQIGPLLGELYRRLQPHPIWRDIDYKVRGDVQRFLKLEVGESLNPQFLFSSGQRRATGIAFLLSVFLSTSWRHLNTIILDDPVQHIDDFRAIHLAEVLAQIRPKGIQVICAVEDPALADLICRRMTSSDSEPGRQITLGVRKNGSLGVVRDSPVSPMPSSVLSGLGDVASEA